MRKRKIKQRSYYIMGKFFVCSTCGKLVERRKKQDHICKNNSKVQM